MQQYFVDEMPEAKQVKLPTDAAHHFIHVMRAKIGDQCEVVLPDQRSFKAQLTDTESATVELTEAIRQNPELPVKVVLACGLPKTKGKPELIVQKGDGTWC